MRRQIDSGRSGFQDPIEFSVDDDTNSTAECIFASFTIRSLQGAGLEVSPLLEWHRAVKFKKVNNARAEMIAECRIRFDIQSASKSKVGLPSASATQRCCRSARTRQFKPHLMSEMHLRKHEKHLRRHRDDDNIYRDDGKEKQERHKVYICTRTLQL